MKPSTKPIEDRRLLLRKDFRNKEIENELRRNIGKLVVVNYIKNPNGPELYKTNDDGSIGVMSKPRETVTNTLRRQIGFYSVSDVQIPLPAVLTAYYTNRKIVTLPEGTLVIGLDKSYFEGTRIITEESENFYDLIKRIFSRTKLPSPKRALLEDKTK
jgi:hypothetical protein